MSWAFFAALLSGFAGALGIGGGGILIIYLAAICNMNQLQAQGINLLFFLPCGVVAIIMHSIAGRIKWKSVWRFILGGVPGVLLGVVGANLIGTVWLGRLFGILLLFLGIKSFIKKADC